VYRIEEPNDGEKMRKVARKERRKGKATKEKRKENEMQKCLFAHHERLLFEQKQEKRVNQK
jgi:uncharacterized protein YaiI (UPF0178 family)